MPKQLSNIQINEITLCKTGKNGLQFIAKAADGAPRVEVPISKTDAVKKIAVGVVYEPDKPDADEDMATAAEIEKAAWSALKNQAVVNKAVHGSEPVGAFLAESYIVKAGDPDGFTEGAWAVVVKVEDDALWDEIEKGEISAFSMGGLAQKTPVQKEGEVEVKKEIHADSMIYATNLKDALTALQAIAEAMGGVVEKMVEMTKAATEPPKPDPDPPAEPSKDDPLAKSVANMQAQLKSLTETVQKIAENSTDGRVTSEAPGTAGKEIDPNKY